MNLLETFRVALRALIANKARSFLTMLGVIIGIGAVVAMVSVGQGAGASITGRINSLGTNLLIVMPGASVTGGISAGQGSANTLTLRDVTAIQEHASAVAAVIPAANRSAQVAYGPNNTSTTITGTTPSFTFVREWPVTAGRFLNAMDVNSQARVAVLGTTVVQSLFGNPNANPVGKMILINGSSFRVVGVLASKGSLGPADADNIIVVPITTMMYSLFRIRFLPAIFASAMSAGDMGLATAQIGSILHFQHGLPPTAPNDFTIMNQTSLLSTLQGITGTLTFLLAGIAAISLLVGGIGIMNIMLVSVTERTREIGIRRAVGARRGDILTQFLLEALTLSLTGGAIGIILGIGLSRLVAVIGHLPSVVFLSAIVVAFVFSALVGIGFGVYPAYRASRHNLVDALRYE